MCYSAEASFTAAAAIGTLAVFTLLRTKSLRALPIALLPALFALQQVAEGVLWLFLDNHLDRSWVSTCATYLYILMALVAWPILFGVSAWMLERNRVRSWLILMALGLGVWVAGYNVWQLWSYPVTFRSVSGSIKYDGVDPSMGIWYLASLSIPFLLSTVPRVPVLGVMALLSFALSAYFYWGNFASTWCFFAALISSWVYLVIASLPDESNQWTIPVSYR